MFDEAGVRYLYFQSFSIKHVWHNIIICIIKKKIYIYIKINLPIMSVSIFWHWCSLRKLMQMVQLKSSPFNDRLQQLAYCYGMSFQIWRQIHVCSNCHYNNLFIFSSDAKSLIYTYFSMMSCRQFSFILFVVFCFFPCRVIFFCLKSIINSTKNAFFIYN